MRILIIEDEKKVANFIKRGLEEERYDVDLAADGQAGLDLALAHKYAHSFLPGTRVAISDLEASAESPATYIVTAGVQEEERIWSGPRPWDFG